MRFLGRAGRQDLGPSASSRCSKALEIQIRDVCKEREKVELTLRDGQSRTPLVSQYVQTDTAVRVDIRVVDAGGEVDFRWLERIVGGEVDSEEENAARVW